MTLDDLIAELQRLRDRCPAAGLATVADVDLIDLRYDRGRVWLQPGELDDDDYRDLDDPRR